MWRGSAGADRVAGVSAVVRRGRRGQVAEAREDLADWRGPGLLRGRADEMKKRRRTQSDEGGTVPKKGRRSRGAGAKARLHHEHLVGHEDERRPPASRRWRWLAGIGVGAVAVGWYLSSGSDDRSFRKWTAAERASATSRCEALALGRDKVTPCIAERFCACAVANYEGRETSIREFQESLLPGVAAYAEPGRFGYFCTDAATSACR